jgi:hypothetical protein
MGQGMSMRLEQRPDHRSGPPAALNLLGLGPEQMEELADDVVTMAEARAIQRSSRPAGERGNLADTNFFQRSAREIAERPHEPIVGYLITSDLRVEGTACDVRARIAERLGCLTRPERARPQEIFTKRFLDHYDWVMANRERVVSHAVQHQAAFVAEPYNPMLLKELRQADLAQIIGCSIGTISRLIRDLLVQFPDTIEREFALLVPGHSILSLKGRYAVGCIARRREYYDPARGGWLISDEELARMVQTEYSLDVQRRVVTKYRGWVDRYLLRPRRSPETDGAGETEANAETEPAGIASEIPDEAAPSDTEAPKEE